MRHLYMTPAARGSETSISQHMLPDSVLLMRVQEAGGEHMLAFASPVAATHFCLEVRSVTSIGLPGNLLTCAIYA